MKAQRHWVQFNHCPVCGSEDILKIEWMPDIYTEKCECNDCLEEFEEVYMYSHTVYQQDI